MPLSPSRCIPVHEYSIEMVRHPLNGETGKDALQTWLGFIYGGKKQTVGDKLSGLVFRLAYHCPSRTNNLPCSFANLKKDLFFFFPIRKYPASPVCFLLKAVLWYLYQRTCISLFSSSEEWCWVQVSCCRLDIKVLCLKKNTPFLKWGKNPGILGKGFL